MGLVHELEELVDNRLQELPVRFQESWVLTNDVPANWIRINAMEIIEL